jgi:DNA-binding MarR family transcriptional regulator
VRTGYIVQHRGTHDRRQRLLELTEKGALLERQLSETQRQRIARAYREAGAEAVEGFRTVLIGIMDADQREAVASFRPRR